MKAFMDKDFMLQSATAQHLYHDYAAAMPICDYHCHISPKEIYEKFAQAGVGTVVGMHFPESHIEEARKNNVNIVISGHMSSDSLGVNLICDVWERHGIDVLPCSGFTRFSRN